MLSSPAGAAAHDHRHLVCALLAEGEYDGNDCAALPVPRFHRMSHDPRFFLSSVVLVLGQVCLVILAERLQPDQVQTWWDQLQTTVDDQTYLVAATSVVAVVANSAGCFVKQSVLGPRAAGVPPTGVADSNPRRQRKRARPAAGGCEAQQLTPHAWIVAASWRTCASRMSLVWLPIHDTSPQSCTVRSAPSGV
jgi:hypothetical protein